MLRRGSKLVDDSAQGHAVRMHLVDTVAHGGTGFTALVLIHGFGDAAKAQRLSLQLAAVSQHGFDLREHVEQLYVDDFRLALSVAIHFHAET
jgi:hypothetical protein